MMDLLDRELVDRVRAGDTNAFGLIVERYQARVFAVACANAPDRTSAEDACQEAFVAGWCQIAQLKSETSLGPWLCGIARNISRKARQKVQREDTLGELEMRDDHRPLDSLLEKHATDSLWTLVGLIPKRYRETMLLHYSGEQSVAEISKCLELSEATVKKRLSRGRDMLRTQATRFTELGQACRVPVSLSTAVVLAIQAQTATAATLASGGSIKTTLAKGLLVKKYLIPMIAIFIAISLIVIVWKIDSSDARPTTHTATPTVHVPPPSPSPALHVPATTAANVDGRLAGNASGRAPSDFGSDFACNLSNDETLWKAPIPSLSLKQKLGEQLAATEPELQDCADEGLDGRGIVEVELRFSKAEQGSPVGSLKVVPSSRVVSPKYQAVASCVVKKLAEAPFGIDGVTDGTAKAMVLFENGVLARSFVRDVQAKGWEPNNKSLSDVVARIEHLASTCSERIGPSLEEVAKTWHNQSMGNKSLALALQARRLYEVLSDAAPRHFLSSPQLHYFRAELLFQIAELRDGGQNSDAWSEASDAFNDAATILGEEDPLHEECLFAQKTALQRVASLAASRDNQ